MSLGINKDLEPLVRKIRRSGGTVIITRRNHVVWTLPGGSLIRTGLTMNRTTSHLKRREIEKALLAVSTASTQGRRTGRPTAPIPITDRGSGRVA